MIFIEIHKMKKKSSAINQSALKHSSAGVIYVPDH